MIFLPSLWKSVVVNISFDMFLATLCINKFVLCGSLSLINWKMETNWF